VEFRCLKKASPGYYGKRFSDKTLVEKLGIVNEYPYKVEKAIGR